MDEQVHGAASEMASPEVQLKSLEGGRDKLMKIADLKEDDLLEKSKEELRELSDEVRASKALAQKMAKLLTEDCKGDWNPAQEIQGGEH